MRPWSEQQSTKILACMQKMLASELFISSPRQKRLLEYLVKHTLEGQANRLKGYTIALEVFDRPEDFDPNLDAIVRVEAGRLRTKLRDYYQDIAESDEVRIELPKGSYQLDFKFNPATNLDINPGLLAQSASVQTNFPALITDRPSLVVLPFINISADNAREYFADGMTDSLISMLSRLSGLFVISRQSSFAYKKTAKSSKEIAAELGVSYLLEGSVQHAGNRVRISAQLIYANDGMHIWSQRYDCEIKDIFILQDEITRQIVHGLQIELSGIEGKMFGHHGTQSIEAYDALLRGISCLRQYTQKSAREALVFFKKSIAIDPDFAAAHAWLARVLCFQWAMYWEKDRTILDVALAHSQTAIALDNDSPYGLSILGWVQLWRKDSPASITACREAVRLDPNNAEALLFLSLSLSSAGLGQEGLTYILKAKRLTPTPAPLYEFALGQSYYVLGDYRQAIAAFEQGIIMSPSFIPTHYLQMIAYAQLGMKEEVKRKVSILKSFSGDSLTVPVVEIWTNEKLNRNQSELVHQIISSHFQAEHLNIPS